MCIVLSSRPKIQVVSVEIPHLLFLSVRDPSASFSLALMMCAAFALGVADAFVRLFESESDCDCECFVVFWLSNTSH